MYFIGLCGQNVHLNSRDQYLDKACMTPKTRFEFSNISLLAHSPSDLHPTTFDSRSRSIHSQIWLVLLYFLPESINCVLALRSRLPYGNFFRILILIELELLDSKKSGLEYTQLMNQIAKLWARSAALSQGLDNGPNQLKCLDEVANRES